MSNALAWIRAKPCLYMDGLFSRLLSHQLRILRNSEIEGRRGVTSDRNEVSQREEVEAWMPTGRSFMDEFLLSIKLKCLAALWLPSPTRQRVKLKAAFKPVALKHDLQERLKLLISPCAKVTLLRNVYFAR